MGREVRKVKAGWEHPRENNGHHKPLLDGNYENDLAEWLEGKRKWDEGFKQNWIDGGWKPKDEDDTESWEEYSGDAPCYSDYMPQWKEEEKTMLMMYEDTTEGTPISPAFETPEELARWLADNNASSFGSMTATYEQWLATIKAGWAPSMIADKNGLHSGVECSS